ncbi:hypothetical protein MPH_08743 [Macrophomina phaseolina MS6]|uniref:Uncharacterized protein n=1 Tax=Macrophomina phaseolina (strain MS6) TaxID=1126212 RepID=K2QW66_MACPH|nr:hypothetical protein MPH_08743 [Macrophomina phaseolina MS6]
MPPRKHPTCSTNCSHLPPPPPLPANLHPQCGFWNPGVSAAIHRRQPYVSRGAAPVQRHRHWRHPPFRITPSMSSCRPSLILSLSSYTWSRPSRCRAFARILFSNASARFLLGIAASFLLSVSLKRSYSSSPAIQTAVALSPIPSILGIRKSILCTLSA